MAPARANPGRVLARRDRGGEGEAEDRHARNARIADAVEESRMTACFCIGPQNGQPACPCMMRLMGRQETGQIQFIPQGCVCPPGAELTCMGENCPRRSCHGLSPTCSAARGA